MQIQTSQGIISIVDKNSLEELQKVAKLLKIKSYQLIKTPERLLKKIKEV